LILEQGWKKIVIQLKQREANIGFDALQEVYTAKALYNATGARIICTSLFTKSVEEAALKLGVELWDGKRLHEELYKHGFFYLPE
jgi:HJR/Mrr/RecB family endonuclease